MAFGAQTIPSSLWALVSFLTSFHVVLFPILTLFSHTNPRKMFNWTQEGPSLDFQSSVSQRFSSWILCPVNYSLLGLQGLLAPTSLLRKITMLHLHSLSKPSTVVWKFYQVVRWGRLGSHCLFPFFQGALFSTNSFSMSEK